MILTTLRFLLLPAYESYVPGFWFFRLPVGVAMFVIGQQPDSTSLSVFWKLTAWPWKLVEGDELFQRSKSLTFTRKQEVK